MAAGIKVVLVDTTLTDPSGAVSQISSDNLAGGGYAFRAIQQLVPGGGEVLVVNVKPGISTTDQRTQGFADAAKADPKFKYVGVQYDQDSASVAAQVTLAALQKNPGIVGIFATNLFSAEGAATGVRQAGKSGKVKIVGFDADPDQITALKQGTVQALIAQHPYDIGTDAVDQAYAALTGKPTTPKIGTKFTIITKANLSSSPPARQRSTRPAADLRPPAYCPANGPPVPCTGGPLAARAARLDPDHAVARAGASLEAILDDHHARCRSCRRRQREDRLPGLQR